MRGPHQKALVAIGFGADAFVLFRLLQDQHPGAASAVGDLAGVCTHMAANETQLACIIQPHLGPTELKQLRSLVKNSAARILVITKTRPPPDDAIFVFESAGSELHPVTIAIAASFGISKTVLEALAKAIDENRVS